MSGGTFPATFLVFNKNFTSENSIEAVARVSIDREISLRKLAVMVDCDFEGNICQLITPGSNRV